jgi:hypothetical protein
VLSLAIVLRLIGVAGGVGPFLATLVDNYGRWGQDAATNVTESVHRVDAFLLIGRVAGRPLTAVEDLLVTGVIFGLAAFVVRHAARVEDAVHRPLSTSVMVATILIGSYHQAYDAVFLVLPVVLAASGAWGTPAPARVGRALVLAGAAVLALNYVSTNAAIERFGVSGALWSAVTLVNAIAMLAVFAGCVAAALSAGAAARNGAAAKVHVHPSAA